MELAQLRKSEKHCRIFRAQAYIGIKILADSSILMVVGENRIRGTVENVYQLNQDAMATEDENGNAVQMSLLSICASFAKYFSTGNADCC